MKTRVCWALLLIFLPGIAASASGQTPVTQPLGNARSPDQHYEWRVRTDNPVRYELTELPGTRVLATVKDYFWDQGQGLAARHAIRATIRWNATSSLVALDEFNYRRAGRLWVFRLKDNQAHPIPFESATTPLMHTTEKRFCLAEGWRSPTLLSLRLAARLTSGEVISLPYLLDLEEPTHPKVMR
ncbi:MAG TPA: hypothetical protein VGD78_04380 [Chthoniobacterales bacterium]